jgi:hypothetical protein
VSSVRDLGLILIITGLILAAAVAVRRVTRTSGQPRKHVRKDDCAERASMAKLRGEPADRFTPGVVVPFTPQLGEPLKPLPPTVSALSPSIMLRDHRELTDEEVASIRARFTQAVKGRPHLIVLPPDAPDADDDIQHAAEQFNPRPGDKPARPAHATDTQTTGEIFEHLCNGPDCWCRPWTPTPDTPPAEVVQGLNGHYTVDAAVESMFTRAQAAQVRALANGQVSDG